MILIERIAPNKWQLLASVRLEALRSDPAAFGSTFERERNLTEEDWNQRIHSSHWYWALDDGNPVGIAACITPDGSQSKRELVSMWVKESFRGTSVAHHLFQQIFQCAQKDGASTLIFCVMKDNQRAIAFYKREGAELTGEVSISPKDNCSLQLHCEVDLQSNKTPSSESTCS